MRREKGESLRLGQRHEGISGTKCVWRSECPPAVAYIQETAI